MIDAAVAEKILSIANRISRSHCPYHEVEDMAGDLVVHAIEAMRTYDAQKGTVEAYVGVVMLRRVYDKTKSSRRNAFIVETDIKKDVDFTPELFSSEHTPEKSYFDRSTVSEFFSRLNGLEKTVCSFLVQGYSVTEIGEKMKLSKGRISQIRSNMKKKFTSFTNEED